MLLPRDIIEHIASFGDIDTRRALGVYGKLNLENIKIVMNKEIYKYYPKEGLRIYMIRYRWDQFMMESVTNISINDEGKWMGGKHTEIYYADGKLDITNYEWNGTPYTTAGDPEIIFDI